MNKFLLILLVLPLVFGGYAYAENQRSCENRICVFPEEYVKFTLDLEFFGEKEHGILTYVFGNFIDSNRIELLEIAEYVGDPSYETRYILDLEKGDFYEKNENISAEEFIFIKKIPISIDELKKEVDLSVSTIYEDTYSVGKSTRDVVVIDTLEGDGKLIIDKNTGLLLFLIATSNQDGSNFKMTTKLFETNIFQDDSIPPQQKNIVLLPQWLKKVAEWWYLKKISNTDFLTSLKFLNEEQIISISTKTNIDFISMDLMPSFREDVRKWYMDEISDSDFVSTIQKIIKSN